MLKGLINMLSNADYIRLSLELHLFFARIMKEHSFFLQAAFTARDQTLIRQADTFRRDFDRFLADVVAVSNRVVSNTVLRSGEVVTPFTLKAEKATIFFTGVNIPTDLTQAELELEGNGMTGNPQLEQRVSMLNQRAMQLLPALIRFKEKILSDVLSCKLFTMNYPLLIEHIMREARLYLQMVQRLENRQAINLQREAYEQEAFWNRIMAEHSLFIRGLLDPTEHALIVTANNFACEFNELTAAAIQAMEKSLPLGEVTKESLRAVREIRGFKQQGTQGILECQIRSIIIPLLGDHVLREANHFLRLLEMFKTLRTSESGEQNPM